MERGKDDWRKEPFVEEFRAVILAVRHMTARSYIQGSDGKCSNKLNYYKSLEFKSFKSPVYVWQDGEFLPQMTYQEAKNMSHEGCENKLWGIAYVLVEGEDIVRKLEVKGGSEKIPGSRNALWDYITEKRDRSVSTLVTKFSLVEQEGDAFSYNMLVLENTGETPADLAGILKAQTALNVILDAQETPSTQVVQGTVVQDADIKLDDTKATMEAINSGQVATEATPTPEAEVQNKGLENMFKD